MFRKRRKTGARQKYAAAAAGTIISKNYLPFARVLASSFREHHPEIPFHVLLMDEVDGCFDPLRESFPILNPGDAGITGIPGFGRGYSREQLLSAAKPYLLSHLLDAGHETAVYLDADIMVLADLMAPLGEAAARGVVLTPHLLEPLVSEDRAARELNILQSGCFNAGFLSVSDQPSSRQFLSWWQKRVREHCQPAVAEGMHLDQRWLDLAPVYFEDMQVMRHPGFNVGHWNLPERALLQDERGLTADGDPCCFFHFSGFDPEWPQVVTRYNGRLTMDDIGPAAAGLFIQYASLLKAAGYEEARDWPFRNPLGK
ncbi:MAG: hypothetical protein HZB44_05380 [Actinobacteria bacterium]|nr:hypothetical protein [Actinomycetota bacterium]